MSDFGANAQAVSMQHIKLETEGWVRDVDLPAARADAAVHEQTIAALRHGLSAARTKAATAAATAAAATAWALAAEQRLDGLLAARPRSTGCIRSS